ncbi:LemA family protein [soil metagenome]
MIGGTAVDALAMSPLGGAAMGLAAVAVLVGLAYLVSFNRFVHSRQSVESSWGTVDSELQRRHDVIPELVATVAQYAAHEREVIARVTAARARAVASAHTPEAASVVEPEVADAVAALVALRTRYPQLDAQANFAALQRELTTTEDRIAAARRYYNTVVAQHNRRCESFPSNVVARRHGFGLAGYFEV